jgi:hypothetical protein
MNAHAWPWILLGSLVTLLAPRLFGYLTRLQEAYPEEFFMLVQPLDWSTVKEICDLDDLRDQTLDGPPRFTAQILLHWRVIECREHFRRMAHNLRLVELCARVDKRDGSAKRARAAYAEILAEAQGMLEGAHALETDAGMAENQGEASELRASATGLRLQAEELRTRAEAIAKEEQDRKSKVADAFHSAKAFRRTVRRQLFKLNLLSVLMRVDRLALIPPSPLINLWHSGNDELLRLYQRARLKAVAYLSIYHENEEILAHL